MQLIDELADSGFAGIFLDLLLDERDLLLRFFFVLDDLYDASWFRQFADSQNLYRLSSGSGLYILAFPVLHPPDLSCRIVGDDDISYFQGSRHHDDRRDDSLLRIHMRIDDDADR